ncbi:allograft inflammatory factor 1-like L homeolog [Xenopus laevis]|uniref:Allograft inflammatory factor 1-like L homeolog n=1 Tax=Xenopus laevis TaxID=8355 RepID=Q6GM30_XENLA|nr:allograft inflammatory factor 1-like L homeolog [Xenopus laevis]AAH74259.1 MGC84014 protein [Xenopus laevis]AAH84814.1 MGC84014 protein [Xenopus laevis]
MSSNNIKQGGKAFVIQKAQQEHRLEEVNKEFLKDEKYKDDEDLDKKLMSFKKKYMEFDLNHQGELDMMGLKKMMENLGAAKTHLEVKKLIYEVTGGKSEAISYRDFVTMMLGKRSAVMKFIMMFEGKNEVTCPKPKGPPPKRDISSLP